MNQIYKIIVYYLIIVLVLSSITISYSSISPTSFKRGTDIIEEESFDRIGLVNGAFLLYWDYYWLKEPTTGFVVSIHTPKFYGFPFIYGATVDNGAIAISVWFIGLAVGSIHIFIVLNKKVKQNI